MEKCLLAPGMFLVMVMLGSCKTLKTPAGEDDVAAFLSKHMVELPSADERTSKYFNASKRQVSLLVDRKGEIYYIDIGEKNVSKIDDVDALLKRCVEEWGVDLPIVLYIDKNANYAKTWELMSICKKYKFTRILLCASLKNEVVYISFPP
jgi:biopolymer transport protein ExbD